MFIKALIKDAQIKVQDIDKAFRAGTNEIRYNNTDADYINIKSKLNKIIK